MPGSDQELAGPESQWVKPQSLTLSSLLTQSVLTLSQQRMNSVTMEGTKGLMEIEMTDQVNQHK